MNCDNLIGIAEASNLLGQATVWRTAGCSKERPNQPVRATHTTRLILLISNHIQHMPGSKKSISIFRSSSWDGGGGSDAGVEGEEANIRGGEGDRLQDIFCKLFQVRTCESVKVENWVKLWTIWCKIANGGDRLQVFFCKLFLVRTSRYRYRYRSWLLLFLLLSFVSRMTSPRGTTLWWASMAWSWWSLCSAMGSCSASSFAHGQF